MVCLPATIDNNVPGTELSIGADTALNNIVSVVDKIKQSAVAERRCYIVEVMGRRCGYLALMSGLATGAERVYLHEEGVTLKSMKEDLDRLVQGFREGKRLGLVIRNEEANPTYDTTSCRRCSRRRAAARSPCARASSATCSRAATRRRSTGSRRPSSPAGRSTYLVEQAAEAQPSASFIGMAAGRVTFHPLEDSPQDDRRAEPTAEAAVVARPAGDQRRAGAIGAGHRAGARRAPARRGRRRGLLGLGAQGSGAAGSPSASRLNSHLNVTFRLIAGFLLPGLYCLSICASTCCAVEVHLAQIARRVSRGLVVEVR